jgi:tetratricopeptide (TPR) repeat protein
LVAEVLGAKRLGAGLSNIVAATGNGSALFATEIAKSLKDQGAVVVQGGEALLLDASRNVELPVTLEAMIFAKVDQLVDDEKTTLQIAAVMGVRFSSTLLQGALGTNIDGHLAALEQAGFVQREAARGKAAYSFVSQQVLDVVNKASVGQQLREYHGRIAAAIESIYRDQLELHFEHLAFHCAMGGRLLDAARNYEMVGDRLRRLAELDRSLKSFKKGISILENVQSSDGSELVLEGIASMHLKAGEVSSLLGDQTTAQRHLQVAQEIAEEVGAIEIDVGCLTALGQLYLANGRLQLAKMIIEQGLSQARISRLPMAEVELLLALASVQLEFGEVDEAKSLQEQALERAKRDPHSEAEALSAIASLHSRFGEHMLARKNLARALELTLVLDDKLLEARLKNNIGIAWFGERQYTKAHSCFSEALEINRGSGHRRGEVFNLHNIGDCLFRLGEEARAHVAFTEAAEIAKGFGLNRETIFNELYLGYLNAVHGDPETGRALLERCIDESNRLKDQDTQLMGRWLLGKLMVHQGDVKGGLTELHSALECAEEAQNNWMAADLKEAIDEATNTGKSE